MDKNLDEGAKSSELEMDVTEVVSNVDSILNAPSQRFRTLDQNIAIEKFFPQFTEAQENLIFGKVLSKFDLDNNVHFD